VVAAFRLPFGERKPDPADATLLSVPAAEAVVESTESLQAGPYVLDEQLAEGGESLVWLATHERDGTPAVVKVQRPGVLPERLRREAAVLYALQEVKTPHVVRLLAAGEDGALGPLPGTLRYREGQSALYCALEVLPCREAGNLLNDVLQRDQPRPLRRREALEVCDALRGALRVMHLDFGMIHNDLKPENVVAWRDGRDGRDGRLHVRLFDFGHAALLSPHPRTGRPCVLPGPGTRYVYDYGTYAFMAPERWHGQAAFAPHGAPSGHTTDTGADPAAVDDRADQWSFAAMVFELLTGRRLVRPATNEREQYRRLILEGRYLTALHDARLPVGAKGALQRALAPDPADRYQGSPSVSGLDFLCRDLEPSLA
jgi:serine/threonine protein kinase